MITNFEVITCELSETEKMLLAPLIAGLKRRTKSNPITADEIIPNMNRYLIEKKADFKLTGARLRKIVNYIRVNHLLPLMATSEGYYTAESVDEIKGQIKSLEERASAIQKAADGLKKFLI